MIDLNDHLKDADGWVLTSALAINEKGQIAAMGVRGEVTRHFLLNPTPEDAANISRVIDPKVPE